MSIPLRVGFTLLGGSVWTGGYNYLQNLFRVLCEENPRRITPVLLCAPGDEALVEPLSRIPGVETRQVNVLAPGNRRSMLSRALLQGADGRFESALDSAGIDVVFEAAQYFGWRLSRPAIAWMPDLQHRFLPHLFPRFSWWKRELAARAQIASSRWIMVSSEDTRAAVLECYRIDPARVCAVPFALPVPREISDQEARAVAGSYGLTENYFFMPNQFWQHKNHELVVDALALMKARGQPCTILATGLQHDPRDPGYFPRLQARVAEAGLTGNLMMPGVVPYDHLAPLMRASVALLNPSLFEGWSTSVEEARVQGVPMILSDLEVHREQAGQSAIYFDRRCPEALADVLCTYVPETADARLQHRLAARLQTPARTKEFADRFVSLVRHAKSSR